MVLDFSGRYLRKRYLNWLFQSSNLVWILSLTPFSEDPGIELLPGPSANNHGSRSLTAVELKLSTCSTEAAQQEGVENDL